MPRGVYPRTPNQLAAARANLARGRDPDVRARALRTQRETWKDPAWRQRVSDGTRAAMQDEHVRQRHLDGLAAARAAHGVNFRHGNGQPPSARLERIARMLLPKGFVRELVIVTAGHGTPHRVPHLYKADFGHTGLRLVVELDGPSHRNTRQAVRDKRKTEVLEALGWTVRRIRHRRP
jgi:hypothetical protein